MNKKKKAEEPIEVKEYDSKGHRLQTRIFARQIHETWCAQPGCKFRGKNAAQGVCFTKEPFAADVTWDHIDKLIAFGEATMREHRDLYSSGPGGAKRWLRYLESSHSMYWMHAASGLDELIRLRTENALLSEALERATKGREFDVGPELEKTGPGHYVLRASRARRKRR